MSNDTPDGNYINCPNCNNTIDISNGTTVNSEVRWKYIGTILSAVTVISLPIIIILSTLGFATLSSVGQFWGILYGTVVLMASTWTFGEKVLQSVYKAKGK